ncbi:Thioredoxin F2 [Arabidopsis thaliana]|uniref:Thioredoxin F2, chloroplastic n=4 Tax=Arabidopsis TaxID=3701 RepID=TRXF2_ARATH|nr:thioredoxin F2 [Arabidopsis thaliana]Q9XFH9.1 RecName: Full=Thioredoxin F2, chloroplastic; Short=AtTrxf2; AltName: Full=Thioredoxin F1; Short=AtTrxf1; Flags: Precursor [Arabidopsis thaliana]KAG7602459.1 Thioredoxin-like superfamily [Arabidopsis thaliana x Arabidopsis arenosa]KAG7609397.1 Thioredoxin-like superfamily [Arabidopsis suecica]AAD35004.1 thioredoxin f2 [Arabidopsis thaliana]AAK44171.1 putative thioredoxin f2 protein [Arabidopsis thaliana]AAL15192.1 putative thioredoxin f2 protein|eukprot:NP_197144.1 thioredoxin F2 [Arabidopsis thaliana]
MPLSLRLAPSPTSFRYSPITSTGAGGFSPVKQHCRIPNSGVATKIGFCSGGGGVLDSGRRIGSCVVRCSLETVNVTVGQVTEVDKDTFWPIVKAAGDKIVVLDMYTQWCGPCKVIAPKYKELSEKYQDMVFLKLDCNQDNKPLAKELGIRVVPTFKILKDNKVVKEVTGAKYEDLLAAIEAARSG